MNEVGTKNNKFPRTCSKCGVEKNRADFTSYPYQGKRYFRSWCKGCMRLYSRNRVRTPYALRSEKEKLGLRRASANSRAEWRKRGLCATVKCERKPVCGIYCGPCKEYQADRHRRLAATRKLDVLTHYGKEQKLQCSCECGCGVTEINFLTIDHVGGRKRHGHKNGFGGRVLYMWLQKNNYPDGFRTLCMNCNFAHGHFGTCPRIKQPSQQATGVPLLPALFTQHVERRFTNIN